MAPASSRRSPGKGREEGNGTLSQETDVNVAIGANCTSLLVGGDRCRQTDPGRAPPCGGDGAGSRVENVTEELRLRHRGIAWRTLAL